MPLKTGQLVNSAMLAPANDSTAVLSPGPFGQLLLTTNGGQTFNQVYPGNSGTSWWAWIGFTTPLAGAAQRIFQHQGLR